MQNLLGFQTKSNINSVGKVEGPADIAAGVVKRLVASQYLNTIADVVTAVNLAYDINYTNSNSYINDYVEKQNSVEIYIEMGDDRPTDIKKFYLLEPDSRTKINCLYGFDVISSSGTRTNRINFFNNTSDSNINTSEVSCYNLITQLNETKLIFRKNQKYTIYRYYFKAEYDIDNETGKINSIVFKLIKDNEFDSILIKDNGFDNGT